MRNFIVITTPKQDVLTPQLAVHLRTFLETRNIPVACVAEMNEKEMVDAITGSEPESKSVEVPQVVINSINKVNDVIIRMRKAGVSNHDITNAIAVATIVDSGMNKNLDILKENIQYVSPDIRIIIDPIWQGHANR